MTQEQYQAELAALARAECDDSRCAGEYAIAEMYTCSWCDDTFCAVHFHVELGCCHGLQCVYQAANRLRELRDAALVALEDAFTWPTWDGAGHRVRTAIEILKEGERGEFK